MNGVADRRERGGVGRRPGSVRRRGEHRAAARSAPAARATAAYAASAARPASSAGSGLALSSAITCWPAGARCSAVISPGSGTAAGAGHAIPTRTARSPSFAASAPCAGSSTPAPTTNDGGPLLALAVLRVEAAVVGGRDRAHDRQRLERRLIAGAVDRAQLDRVDPGTLRLGPRERVPAVAEREPPRRPGGRGDRDGRRLREPEPHLADAGGAEPERGRLLLVRREPLRRVGETRICRGELRQELDDVLLVVEIGVVARQRVVRPVAGVEAARASRPPSAPCASASASGARVLRVGRVRRERDHRLQLRVQHRRRLERVEADPRPGRDARQQVAAGSRRRRRARRAGTRSPRSGTSVAARANACAATACAIPDVHPGRPPENGK